MPDNPEMAFESFIESAWNDHADHPDDVALRLANSLALLESAANIPPYVRLVVHVHGEHLGKWREGIALLESIDRMPSRQADPALAAAVNRGVATLRYAGGETQAIDDVGHDDKIAVLATASSALAGRRLFDRALSAYAAATQLAQQGETPGPSAVRALAAGGNNLAAALEAKPDRDARETEGMIAAANAALQYWKLAGTWLEEERAEFRLSRSLLLAGDHRGAIASATRCVDICSKNQAPAFEQFFGSVALALAYRAAGERTASDASRTRALTFYDLIAPDEGHWCDAEFNELNR